MSESITVVPTPPQFSPHTDREGRNLYVVTEGIFLLQEQESGPTLRCWTLTDREIFSRMWGAQSSFSLCWRLEFLNQGTTGKAPLGISTQSIRGCRAGDALTEHSGSEWPTGHSCQEADCIKCEMLVCHLFLTCPWAPVARHCSPEGSAPSPEDDVWSPLSLLPSSWINS